MFYTFWNLHKWCVKPLRRNFSWTSITSGHCVRVFKYYIGVTLSSQYWEGSDSEKPKTAAMSTDSRSQANCKALFCTNHAYWPSHCHLVVNLSRTSSMQTMINGTASFARVPWYVHNLVRKTKIALRNSIITLLLPVTEYLANQCSYIFCSNCHSFTIIQLWSWLPVPSQKIIGNGK